jgi:hypothetical protein
MRGWVSYRVVSTPLSGLEASSENLGRVSWVDEGMEVDKLGRHSDIRVFDWCLGAMLPLLADYGLLR